jgi:streptomycin 6-kinase
MRIPDMVRAGALLLGAEGEAWLDSLPDLAAELAVAWDLELGEPMTGGTAAVVLAARTAAGREAVLKLPPPLADPTLSEARTLIAGHGRGYAQLLAHDPASGAMLLERLGPQLFELGLPLDDQLVAICETLRLAWTASPTGEPFMDGREKAHSLAAIIEAEWEALGRPCARRTVDAALAFAAERGAAFDPDKAVLAHGDAHAWNTLLVPGPGPRRFKFVDPDGAFIEPAYDLAIPMREWAADLLAGDPAERGLSRCRRLAELTGLAPGPIWRWGLVERVSTGLLNVRDGFDGAADFLTVADAWALAEPPPL